MLRLETGERISDVNRSADPLNALEPFLKEKYQEVISKVIKMVHDVALML